MSVAFAPSAKRGIEMLTPTSYFYYTQSVTVGEARALLEELNSDYGAAVTADQEMRYSVLDPRKYVVGDPASNNSRVLSEASTTIFYLRASIQPNQPDNDPFVDWALMRKTFLDLRTIMGGSFEAAATQQNATTQLGEDIKQGAEDVAKKVGVAGGAVVLLAIAVLYALHKL